MFLLLLLFFRTSFVSCDEPRSQSQSTAGFFLGVVRDRPNGKICFFGEVSLYEYKPEGKLAGWFEDGGESLRGMKFLYLRKQFMYQNVHINCSRSSIPQIFAPPPFYFHPPPHTHTHIHTERRVLQRLSS